MYIKMHHIDIKIFHKAKGVRVKMKQVRKADKKLKPFTKIKTTE